MMDNLELRPPKQNALASGLAETSGGALLVLGAATPLAAAVLNASMLTAIRKVTWTRARGTRTAATSTTWS